MQYYRDGFHAGDPRWTPRRSAGGRSAADGVGVGVDVDVLIVGSGPAGLVLATVLAGFPSIRTRVTERREGPMQLGQADGVACRTIEMFQALGVADRLLEEAYWVNETSFWKSDPENPASIIRTGRVQDVEDGLSEMPHVIMNQARIHEYLLDAMRRSPTRLEPDYGTELVDLTVPLDGGPVVATLRNSASGESSLCRAGYVVGCDGSRSRVRDAIGRSLDGDRANHAWGVMDVLAVTDFPDIRLKAAIQNAEHGSLLLIPREGGYLLRLYVDLGTVTDNRQEIRAMSSEDVVAVAQRILHPYSLDIRETVWFSVYEVAQRIADGFDDAVGRNRLPRVFIAGDACHTHSAKAGQGMNVSMQDAFNLSWKLAAVLEGRADPTLLQTYDDERRPVAQELIDFDREWSTMLAATPTGADSTETLSKYFVRQGRYTAGVATRYPASRLIDTDENQFAAAGFTVGMRFHSAPVTRVADCRRVELGHTATADGRWRLYAFADADESLWRATLDWLASAPASPLVAYSDSDADIDAVIDVRGILQRPAHDVSIGELPMIMRPATGKLGLVDLEKAFASTTSPDAHEADVFDIRKIDRGEGALVLVRPDQYVAQVLPLHATTGLGTFLSGIMTR
ncbi:MAG: FAD-dependent monooxygenase [Mycobacterium sp.]